MRTIQLLHEKEVRLSNRTKKVIELSKEEYHGPNDRDFIRAYVGCLSGTESAELLLYACIHDFDLRWLLLRKIETDMEIEVNSTHRKLIKDLIDLSLSQKYREANSIAYCLSILLEHVKSAEENLILNHFLDSERIGFRRRAYKFLSYSYDNKYEAKLLKNWADYKDKEILKIFIYNFPKDFLLENRKSLLKEISEGWLAAKLYIQIAPNDIDIVDELIPFGIATYSYCLAKLGEKIPKRNKNLYKMGDENDGLTLWSLGRLQEWDLITELENEYRKNM